MKDNAGKSSTGGRPFIRYRSNLWPGISAIAASLNT